MAYIPAMSTVPWRRAAAGAGVGLAGSILVAVATVALSYTGFGTSRADSTPTVRWVGRLLGAAGLVALALGWWRVRRVRERGRWLLLALWSLPLLAAPPVGSRDAYAYAEQGWLVAHGHDPYTTPMATLGSPFSGLVDSWWQGQTTVYPPLALEVQSWVVRLTGESPYLSVIAMRVPAIFGLILIGLCLPRLADRAGGHADTAGWLILLNPVVLVHVVGGAHNDALAVGLAVLALWLAIRPGAGWLVGAVVLGLAVGVKQPLALVGLAIAAATGARGCRPWPQILVRAAVVAAVSVATFSLVAWATGLGWGWLVGSGSPYSVVTIAPTALLADVAARLGIASFAGALGVLGPIGLVIAGLWILRDAVLVLPGAPIAFVGRALVVVALLSPALQTWYLLWGAVFVACIPLRRRTLGRFLAVVAMALTVLWAVEWVGLAPLWGALLAGVVGGSLLFVRGRPSDPTAPRTADRMAI